MPGGDRIADLIERRNAPNLSPYWDRSGRQQRTPFNAPTSPGMSYHPLAVEEKLWEVMNYLAAKARGVETRPGNPVTGGGEPVGLTPAQRHRLEVPPWREASHGYTPQEDIHRQGAEVGLRFGDEYSTGARLEGYPRYELSGDEIFDKEFRGLEEKLTRLEKQDAQIEYEKRDLERRRRQNAQNLRDYKDLVGGGEKAELFRKKYIERLKGLGYDRYYTANKPPPLPKPSPYELIKTRSRDALGRFTKSALSQGKELYRRLQRRGLEDLERTPHHGAGSVIRGGRIVSVLGLRNLGKADLPEEEYPVRRGENIMQDPRAVARNRAESTRRWGQPADSEQRAAQEAVNRAAYLRRLQEYEQEKREAERLQAY
jgi:hypothetical protein